MNVRSYRKIIREMKSGETFFLNAISASVAVIEETRTMIQNGVIAPVREEIEKKVTTEVVDKYMSGEYIAPQMDYIKL